MKKISFLILLLLNAMFTFAGITGPEGGVTPGENPAPAIGSEPKYNPIDTNAIILIIAAAVLILGVVAYKKLSLKKA